MTQTSDPVVVEQVFEVTPEVLWNAITQRDQMVEWFFENIPEFRPESGFETTFVIDTGERQFSHLWKIVDAEPGRRVVYDWRYEEYPGVGKVTFEVLPDEAGSRLRVVNEGLETFPDHVPEFSRESCVGGWQYFIQGNLKNFLATPQGP